MHAILILVIVAFGTGCEDGDVAESQARLIDMLYIEGGTFEMGDIDEAVPLASPVHTGAVSSFELARYEVSVEQFAAFVAATDHVTSAEDPTRRSRQAMQHPEVQGDEKYLERLTTRGAWVLTTPSEGKWIVDANWRNPQYGQRPEDPVTDVSWWDAVSYCDWLSRKDGLPVAYDRASGELLDDEGRPTTDVTRVRGYRLPTEAEWEFAAGERGREIRFGGGWEWCSDFVDRYPSGSTTNPYQVQGDIGQRRAARGGRWVGDASLARVSARFGWVAEDRCNNIGFRVARSR